MMTTEQLNTILAKLLPKNSKSGTRKVHAFSPVQSDTEDVHMFGPKTKVGTNNYSNEDSIYLGLNSSRDFSSQYDENSP